MLTYLKTESELIRKFDEVTYATSYGHACRTKFLPSSIGRISREDVGMALEFRKLYP